MLLVLQPLPHALEAGSQVGRVFGSTFRFNASRIGSPFHSQTIPIFLDTDTRFTRRS
eukprot:COSAG02_NODE_50289_length_321_cov_0.950450_1_plen_56_part_01